MNSASRPSTANAMAGPTRKCRSLPAPIGMDASCPATGLDSALVQGPGPSGARVGGHEGPCTFECATPIGRVRGPEAGLLPVSNRPRLRGHAVPFIAEGARPPLGHAHLRRPLLAGRVQCPV